MKIIAFWKDNPGSSFYEEASKKLAASAKRCGFKALIEHREDSGEGYTEITRFKPQFILEKLEELKEGVMYVDVDSVLRPKAEFKSEKIIFTPRHDGSPHGHALYFPYTQESIDFLKLWASELEAWKGGDHSKLLELWHSGSFPARPFSKPFVDLTFSKSPSKSEEVAALEAEGWREEVLTLRAEAVRRVQEEEASDANAAPVSATEGASDTLPADGGQEAPEALKIAPKAKPAKKPAAKKAKKAPAKKKAAPKKKKDEK